jgi:hypothetical protein
MTSPQIRSPFWCCALFLIDNRMLRRKKIAALCTAMNLIWPYLINRQSLGTKKQEVSFILGIMRGNDDALSHHWRFGWGVVGTALQSPYSCPMYFDHRVRNRRNGATA